MIHPDFFDYLSDLKANNTREWFQENKKKYDLLRQHLVHTCEILIHEISNFDKSISGIQPKDCIFRINRDIRFSKDKSPYKSNMGAFFAPGGRNSGKAGYYIHIEPGNCFVAGGIYMPPSPLLKAIRQEIFENYSEFQEIVQDRDFVKYWGDIESEKLKTRPRGFPEDFEGIEYLRMKNFTVIAKKSDKQFANKEFLKHTIKEFEALYPLNRFINNIQ